MSFLDNLETSLKNLEAQSDRDPAETAWRERNRAAALAAAPWAEKLKSAPFTQAVMESATLAGRRLRTKVYLSWLEGALVLQARERKLRLRPTAEGIVADFVEGDGSERHEPVDLDGDAASLIGKWLPV